VSWESTSAARVVAPGFRETQPVPPWRCYAVRVWEVPAQPGTTKCRDGRYGVTAIASSTCAPTRASPCTEMRLQSTSARPQTRATSSPNGIRRLAAGGPSLAWMPAPIVSSPALRSSVDGDSTGESSTWMTTLRSANASTRLGRTAGRKLRMRSLVTPAACPSRLPGRQTARLTSCS